MNYWDIMEKLSDAGIDVALPGMKQDICTAPYAVVQNSGTYPYAVSSGLGYTLITVHCYAPLNGFRQLGILIERVKAALRTLEPDLRPTGNDGVQIINDKFRAHEGSVQYIIMRSLRTLT